MVMTNFLLEKQYHLNTLICILRQGSCFCVLYDPMQITNCLADLKSYISHWAYFKSGPQVVWAVPCFPQAHTMWKKLTGFINYLTTFRTRVAHAHKHACTRTCLYINRSEHEVVMHTFWWQNADTLYAYLYSACTHTHTHAGHISLCRVWVVVGPHRAVADHMPVINMSKIMHEPFPMTWLIHLHHAVPHKHGAEARTPKCECTRKH